MKKFAKLVVFLLLLCGASVVTVAEGIDGLWGGLTQENNTIYTNGDQWGFYFEDDVCYYAYCFDGKWLYLSERPLGLVKPDYKPNTYKSSDTRVTFTLKGERLFVESKPQGSVHLETFAVKKIVDVKPKEATMAELQEKAKKYNKTK